MSSSTAFRTIAPLLETAYTELQNDIAQLSTSIDNRGAAEASQVYSPLLGAHLVELREIQSALRHVEARGAWEARQLRQARRKLNGVIDSLIVTLNDMHEAASA